MKKFELKGKTLVNRELTENILNDSDKNKWINLGKSTVKLIRRANELQEQWFKKQLLLVEPPIKGEITKGKLKWRGVKLCNKQGLSSTLQSSFMNTTYWVEQRGKKIGVEYVEQFNLVKE